MANQPSIYKTKISLQLDNEVVVALDKKAEADGTSRNAVANYLLSDRLDKIISAFSADDKNRVKKLIEKNKQGRKNAK